MDNTTVQSYDPSRKARISHPGSAKMYTNKVTNASNDIVLTGVAGKSWYYCFSGWRVGGGAINASTEISITLKDGDTVVYESLIAKGGAEGLSGSQENAIPVKITEGNSLTKHIGASGVAGTYIISNISAYLA